MKTDAQLLGGRFVDLSSRVVASTVVVASPTGASETIIASVALPSGLTINSGVYVLGWFAFTVGTAGTAVTACIRRTSVNGAAVVASGALTAAAANVDEGSIHGFDTAPGNGQVYKLTMTVANASATSTVSAATVVAIAV